MLEKLNDIDWASFEDAYGPAVDVPDQIRALTKGGEDAQRGLGDLYAGIFHQGSYFDSTPLAVPFLVELVLDPAVPERRHIVQFLAELTSNQSDAVIGWDPYAWRSTPGPPDYPEAVDTLAALNARSELLIGLLRDDEAEVRLATSRLLAGLGLGAEAIRTCARTETDTTALGEHLLALAKLGEDAASFHRWLDADDARVRGCAAIALTWSGASDDLERLMSELEAAALRPAEISLEGSLAPMSLAPLVSSALGIRAREAAEEVAALAYRVVQTRLERGDRVAGPPRFPSRSLNDDRPEPEPVCHETEEIRALVGVLAPTAFEHFYKREKDYVLGEELDERQRSILRWTVDHRLPIPVPGIPWIRPEAMKRFLDGGGPLEGQLEVGRRTSPIWRWLVDVDSEDSPALSALVESRSPKELLELADDMFTYAYSGYFGPCLKWDRWGPIIEAIDGHIDELADDIRRGARKVRDSERSSSSGARTSRREETLFYVPLLDKLGSLDEKWDDLLLSYAGYDTKQARSLFERFSIERRSRIIGRAQAPFVRKTLRDLCDEQIFIDTTIETFLSPGWWAEDYNTEDILRALGEEAIEDLEAALTRATGSSKPRASLLKEVISDLRGESEYILELGVVSGTLHAKLLKPDGEQLSDFDLPLNPKEGDFKDITALLEMEGASKLMLRPLRGASALNHTLEYRVQRLLYWNGMRSISCDGGAVHSRST